MAIASSFNDLNCIEKDIEVYMNSLNESQQRSNELSESISSLRKMFPNFDIEIVESVVRSNNGSVDKSIDILLAMYADYDEEFVPKKSVAVVIQNSAPDVSFQSRQDSELNINVNSVNLNDSLDQPPSYNELVSMNRIDSTSSTISSLVTQSKTIVFSQQTSTTRMDTLVKGEACSNRDSRTQTQVFVKNSTNITSPDCTTIRKLQSSKYVDHFNRILIGDLSKDFLRVKINNDQVKKLKSSVKKVKRREIVDMLNNVSFFIQKKTLIILLS
jgi:hypothetical protein